MKIIRYMAERMIGIHYISLILTMLVLCIHGKEVNVAVCVSGQLSRWVPDHLAQGLLKGNPKFSFYIFANMHYHLSPHNTSFGSNSHLVFALSHLTDMSPTAAKKHLEETFTLAYAKLASVQLTLPPSEAFWLGKLNRPSLDIIHHHAHHQSGVLNMYQHQVTCAEQIFAYEQKFSINFTYVVSTREDIYYMQPLNLEVLLDSVSEEQCDIVTKDCMRLGAMHSQWHLLQHPQATHKFLQNRIKYYQILVEGNRVREHVEDYEKTQAKHYGLKVCTANSELIPTTVARHLKQGQVCFLKIAVFEDCFPAQKQAYAKENMCHRLSAHHRLQKFSKK